MYVFVVVFFQCGGELGVCAHVQLRVGVYHRKEKEGGKGRGGKGKGVVWWWWCGRGCCYFGALECSLH